ncbi:DUF2834 domain-containing protein [Alcanivorax sp. S6407]|uniref:DUF2834 domain-containing protein n=1 Tax=Alcanivorax sp. S6407 TaxID=2926424 RepID=UPI001FF4ABBC|nr:DUF2834 domain-containing protein [Alcanivorax sp. S6407]MCK0152130.1 DUF2834 domain-containing protein [Alcanivorax sp. S6407]
MNKNERMLCWGYGAIAMIALVATWSNNIAFAMETGSLSLIPFVEALYVNHAAASIANDILLLCVSAFIFMVHEARRVGVRHVWVYILLSGMIAIAVMFPVFLIARQKAIAARRGRDA